jgi:transposase
MKKVKEILKQFSSGNRSIRNIAQATKISRPTVAAYLAGFQDCGMTIEEALKLPEDVLLDRLLAANRAPKAHERLEALYRHFAEKAKDLKKKGVTKLLLWEEYCARASSPYGSPYGYTQYCEHLKRWTDVSPELRCLIEHKPGEKLFIDYSGKRIPYMSPLDGIERYAEVFVAILGGSQLTFLIALISQREEDTILGCSMALEFYGGAPLLIVPDCMKTAVTQADRYEPIINKDFERFADHYGMIVVPARAMKPRDKALVENAVLNVQRRILAPLRDRRFESVEEINSAFTPLLKAYNERSFQRIDASRMGLFLESEKAMLRPLPVYPYEHRIISYQKVPNTYHVLVREDGHRYSVPCTYAGKRVRVETSARTVEIYAGCDRIAFHIRDRTQGGVTTLDEHRSEHHRTFFAQTEQSMTDTAKTIGLHAETFIERLYATNQHPEPARRSACGIVNLAKKYGNGRTDMACRLALGSNSISYRAVKSLLEKGYDIVVAADERMNGELPFHENVRGALEYQ